MLDEIRKLNLPKGEFSIFGSGPICVRGLKEWADVDLIVTEELFDTLSLNKSWTLKISENGSEMLLKGNIEAWKDWKPGDWDIKKLILESEIIDGLPFVRLDEVVKWKKLRGKKKDLIDISLIS
jgi:hypothetical protein